MAAAGRAPGGRFPRRAAECRRGECLPRARGAAARQRRRLTSPERATATSRSAAAGRSKRLKSLWISVGYLCRINFPARGFGYANFSLAISLAPGIAPAACTVGGLVHVSVADGSVHRLSQAGCHWEPVASVVPRIVHRAVPDDADHTLLIGGAANAENLELVERVPVR